MSRSLFAILHRRFGPRDAAVGRRELLKASLAAGASMMLSRRVGAGTRARAGGRVVVVGAGLAGLACAFELKSAGYAVTVADSRARVGGRVVSLADVVPGKNVEGGGEFIGANHPAWTAYAKRFGLELIDVTEDEEAESPVILGGERLSKGAAAELYESMGRVLSRMNADAEPIDADAPWESPAARELDARHVQGWLDQVDADPRCLLAVRTQLAADNAVEPIRQSFLGMLAAVKGGGLGAYWTDSESFRCRAGNQRLAERLAAEIGADRVLLKLAVRGIEAKGESMTVTAADGRAIECDDVVLATPPSTWSKIDIRPAIAPTIAPQMGVSVKYLSALTRRFWTDSNRSPYSLSDGDVSMTWDATDHQNGDGACLAAFSGGHAAELCCVRDGRARDAAYRAALESLYPGVSRETTGTRFMNWPADPWTLAGYSFPAPGQVTTVGPLLRKGMGRLHFAGEHCCYKFVGYMEGALTSGVELAARLAARDGAVP